MTPFNRPRRAFMVDPPPKLRPHIEVGFRWLCGSDLGQVAAIEAASFPYPLSMEELDLMRMSQGIHGLVAEYNGIIAGFLFYSFNRGWLELHDLAVHPELRRHGVGRQCMDRLREKLDRDRRRQMTATLRETNRDGLEYLKASGWRATGLVRGFYGDSGEDAVIMVYRQAAPDMELLGRGWEA
jgi:ribosomal-protein-alanine N-acetyltransferase